MPSVDPLLPLYPVPLVGEQERTVQAQGRGYKTGQKAGLKLTVLAIIIGLIALQEWARLAHRNQCRSKFWWSMERIRSCLAYEGDPGPWCLRRVGRAV